MYTVQHEEKKWKKKKWLESSHGVQKIYRDEFNRYS